MVWCHRQERPSDTVATNYIHCCIIIEDFYWYAVWGVILFDMWCSCEMNNAFVHCDQSERNLPHSTSNQCVKSFVKETNGSHNWNCCWTWMVYSFMLRKYFSMTTAELSACGISWSLSNTAVKHWFEGVFTLGDAQPCFGLRSKITPLGSKLNFDIDVKKMTAYHQCENCFTVG